jgi:3-amino-5-hydroxybenzoate synthase
LGQHGISAGHPANQQLAALGGQPFRSRPFPPWPRATPANRAALLAVLDSGHWWQSGWQRGALDELEGQFTSDLGVLGTVLVSHGTAALELAFEALDLAPGSEVLVPATTFVATATAVAAAGTRPVPVDVDPATLCLDVAAARALVTSETRAVAPVHLAGNAADMGAVAALAAEHRLKVVEDVAQAYGTRWNDKPLGCFGDAAITSFQAAKVLPAGEGGAVFIRSDPELLRRVHRLAHCGTDPDGEWYEHVVIGSNRRLTEFQAALVLAHMSEARDLASRRAVAATELAGLIRDHSLGTPMGTTPGTTARDVSAFWLWLPDDLAPSVSARAVARLLVAEGTPAAVMYPPWHLTAAFSGIAPPGSCPVAERAHHRSLWFHHRMLLDGEQGVADIAGALAKVLGHLRQDPAIATAAG